MLLAPELELSLGKVRVQHIIGRSYWSRIALLIDAPFRSGHLLFMVF